MMVQIRSLVPVLIFLYFFICNAFKTGSKHAKYEVYLNDVYNCAHPQPPYRKNRRVVSNNTVNVLNGKRYLSGYTTVTSPTPFTNFSARTFFVNNTKRVIKMEVSNVTCKNVFARTLITITNFSVTHKNCTLKQGRYQYDNVDVNKVSHALPNWHASGHVVHQLQVVSEGATDLCDEISVTIKHG